MIVFIVVYKVYNCIIMYDYLANKDYKYCRFIHTISNYLSVDVQLIIKCLKCLHSCINSYNEVVKLFTSSINKVVYIWRDLSLIVAYDYTLYV